MYDVRGFEHQFNLEEHGFQYYKLPHIPGEGIVYFNDEQDPTILGVYYAGMSEWFAQECVKSCPSTDMLVLTL